MNTKLISLLVMICSVSVLIIGVEWGFSLWTQKSTLDSLVATENKATQDIIPHIDLDKKTEESYADLVERPLFIKGRRPVEEISVDEAQATLAPVIFEWQLNGVFSTKKGMVAFLSHLNAKNSKDKYRKVSKDEMLDGWKLTEIYQDKILFVQGDQQKELLLRKVKNKTLQTKNNILKKLPTNAQAPEAESPENTNE